MIGRTFLFLWILALLAGCSSNSTTENEAMNVKVEVAFPNLTFEQPLDFQFPDDGSNRLFIVEQPGRIWVIDNDPQTSERRLFLDISGRIDDRGWEEGLLGLAFHPDYVSNGYFYVNYTATDPDRTVVSRFSVSEANPDSADADSEFEIITYRQPYSNHNGGGIVFGPDGYLYITAGDGGSAGDPQNNGQDRTTLLGALLRINIDNTEDGRNYAIPPDNPFVGNDSGFAEEIYAWGLRNVWRFSFDEPTGRLWAADVGQNRIEEIDLIVPGGNYGWNIMEGTECYNASDCDTTGLILPVAEYTHEMGQSITGGYVYRGERVPELTGMYIYADFMTGRIWGLRYENETAETALLMNSGLTIASFGVDQNDELYMTVFDGKIYRFAPAQ